MSNAIKMLETELTVGKVTVYIHAYNIADVWALQAIADEAGYMVAECNFQSCARGLDADNLLELEIFWRKVHSYLSPSPLSIARSNFNVLVVIESKLSRLVGRQVDCCDMSMIDRAWGFS